MGITLGEILISGLSRDVELASTIIKVDLIYPNYAILLRVLLVLVYWGLELAIFYILWSKASFLLKGGDKSSLVYVNSKLMCDFFVRFKSLLIINGGIRNKLLLS